MAEPIEEEATTLDVVAPIELDSRVTVVYAIGNDQNICLRTIRKATGSKNKVNRLEVAESFNQ